MSVPRKIVLPFYVVGLALTFFAVELFGFSASHDHDAHVGWSLMATTPILCAGLGAVLARKAGSEWQRLLFLAPVAGALNGAITTIAAFGPDCKPEGVPLMLFFGGIFGGICSAAYLPALAFVAQSTSSIASQARKDSVFERVGDRRVWRATACVVGSIMFVAVFVRDRQEIVFEPLVVTFASIASAIVLAILLALDLRSLREMHAFMARPKRPAATSNREGVTIDYGRGAGVYEEIAALGSAYRETERIVRTYVGDPAQTIAFLHREMIANGAAFVGLALVTAMGIPRSLPERALVPPAYAPDPPQALYDEHVRGAMIGLDGTGRYAYVAHAEDGTIDTIDLVIHKRTERHEYPIALDRVKPADDATTPESPFAWYAAIAPLHVDRPGASRDLVVSADRTRFVYRDAMTNGGAWQIIDPNPAAPRSVPSLTPQDVPLFSPDGHSLAWARVAAKPCDLSSCEASLYIARIPGKGVIAPLRIESLVRPESPVWSADGRYVYVVADANDDTKRSCLFRVLNQPPYSAASLLCRDWSKFRFEQDEAGASAIVSGTRSEAGASTLDVDWIDLPSGDTKERLTPRDVVAITLPYSAGLALVMRSNDFAIYDLKGKCAFPIPSTELRGWPVVRVRTTDTSPYEGKTTSAFPIPSTRVLEWPVRGQWIEPHVFIAQFEHKEPEVEIRAIDTSTIYCSRD